MDPMEMDDSVHFKRIFTKEGLVTSADLQIRKSLSRCVSVCLGLLCVVLLAGNVGQIICYKKLSHHMTADLSRAGSSERQEFESRLSNLTTERDQLQHNYSSLRQDRDQLQRNYSSLRTDKETLQTGFDDLKREKNELQTQFNSIRTNRDELQRSYSSVRSEKDQLQTHFNTLQREKDQLSRDYSTLRTVKDELEKQVNIIKARPCESGWMKFDISCYFVSSAKKNWSQSRDDCVAKGADLVIINSKEEQTFVAGLTPSEGDAWIGLTDSVEEGTWKWVDGTSVTTTYWKAGQPNNYKGGDQDCVEMFPGGDWNDEGCQFESIWICEK